MAIAIKIAETAGERDRALQLRYQVYVDEEERFAERADGRIFDRFDCFPTTGSVLATDMDTGVDVGTLRFAVRTDAGLPSDSFYDFSPYHGKSGGRDRHHRHARRRSASTAAWAASCSG